MNKIPFAIISLFVLLLNTAPYIHDAKYFEREPKKIIVNPFAKYDFRNLRDTVYTLKDHFIEVNLLTQYATLYSRDGSVMKIPVSSGTEKVEEGIDTREGLFVLQWKEKKLYSEQFDSTLMLYWMGFNGGIGFHALEGKSYYKYLGKKNVSHGCVRMSREDAEMLYSLLEKGTPILVYKGNAAIKISFTEESDNYTHLTYKQLRNSLPERYSVLYNGEYFLKIDQKLLLDEKNVPASGLPVGDASLIPPKQSVISPYLWISPETPEFVKINSLLDGNIPGFLTLNLTLDTKTSHQKI